MTTLDELAKRRKKPEPPPPLTFDGAGIVVTFQRMACGSLEVTSRAEGATITLTLAPWAREALAAYVKATP